MRNLGDTISRLAALSRGPVGTGDAAPGRLRELTTFGANPGALRAFYHLPDDLKGGAPLVVVLHGCTQTAATYDRGSGWSELADELGFAVLLPEQARANNPNLCFNWFNPDDTRRGRGEALSIHQMIAAMIARHELDPARVFVTGLSAGGAMTSAMLASYPEVFAGGAIVAGLPFGTAASVPEAFDRMRGHGGPPAAELGALVAAASGHRGPWPTISVWHGSADKTVSAANAGLIVEQWQALHGLPAAPTNSERTGGHTRRVWRNAAGRELIEEHRIEGLGHGTPLATSGAEACGAAGPFMLESGISSTRRIARFWGLERGPDLRAGWPEERAVQTDPQLTTTPTIPVSARLPELKTQSAGRQHSGVGTIIEDALRAAGLMR